jgi:hypothetical protein
MKGIYTLTALTTRLNLQLNIHRVDHPELHAHVFRQYRGYDWLHYIRHEKHLVCSLPISGTSTRDVMLVCLAPRVIYPLKQVETIRLLEGDVCLHFDPPIFDSNSRVSADDDDTTFLVGKRAFLQNGKGHTTLLCMTNRTL